MLKNYYRVLGIASDASPGAVKEAYRRLAKTFHPDHFGADDKPFKDIQEAYTILSDPVQRRCHDGRLQTQACNRPTPADPERDGGNIRVRGVVEPLIPESENFSGRQEALQPSLDDLIRELFDCFGLSAETRREKPENHRGMVHIRIT